MAPQISVFSVRIPVHRLQDVAAMETSFLPGQNYDCVRCGKSCREKWRIHADVHTEKQIAESALAARRIAETGVSSVFVKHPEHAGSLVKRHDGACIFLRSDDRCAVHAELGVNAKPVGCRTFPFLPVNTPDGVFVGITFYCTAAKRNHGRPMDAHVWGLKELLPMGRMYVAGFERQKLSNAGNGFVTWPVYRRLETLVREGGMARALLALVHLNATLEGAVSLEALEKAWMAAQPDRLATNDRLHRHEQLLLTQILITLEITETGACEEAVDAFLTDRKVSLTQSGWTGTARSLDPFISSTPAWLEAEITRYEAALIFRKFLALHRPLVTNTAVLYAMPRLFRLYSAISAANRKAPEIEREDCEYAFDRLELFLTHTTNESMDRSLEEFAGNFATQIGMPLNDP
jgi:Fe-S-cluster containining protein